MAVTLFRLSFLALLAAAILSPDDVVADSPDWPLANGWFYSQAAGSERSGFAVVDDDQAGFWGELQRLGGVDAVGYPISERFIWDGFLCQAFQKLVLQWRPEAGQAYGVNVMDILHRRGMTGGWSRHGLPRPRPIGRWTAENRGMRLSDSIKLC